MRRLVPLVLLLAACEGGRRLADPRLSGTVHLEQSNPSHRTIVDGPAHARWCRTDSTLSVAVVNDEWTAAIALRTAWPPVPGTFAIDSVLGEPGTAAAAVRSIGDTVRLAVIAQRGELVLESASPLGGRLSFEAGADSARAAFAGRFSELRADTAACPTP